MWNFFHSSPKVILMIWFLLPHLWKGGRDTGDSLQPECSDPAWTHMPRQPNGPHRDYQSKDPKKLYPTPRPGPLSSLSPKNRL